MGCGGGIYPLFYWGFIASRLLQALNRNEHEGAIYV